MSSAFIRGPRRSCCSRINSVFSALTCIPIFLIARRIFSEKVAVGAAWTWALLPYVDVLVHTLGLGNESLGAAVAVILWLALTMEERDGLKPWLWFGLLWGIAALNSTVLLSFLPASGLWAWYHRARRRKPSLAGVVLASAGFSWPASRPGPCATIKPSASSFSSATTLALNCTWETATAPTAHGCRYLHPTQDLYCHAAVHRDGRVGIYRECASGRRWITSRLTTDGLLSCASSVLSTSGAGPPRLAQIWWLAEVRNSLFLASSVLMFWGLGRAAAPAQTGRLAAVLADPVISGDLLRGVSRPALPASD